MAKPLLKFKIVSLQQNVFFLNFFTHLLQQYSFKNKIVQVIFWYPAVNHCASFVASHTCTLCSLLSNVQNVQVSDTTGDAMKYKSWL